MGFSIFGGAKKAAQKQNAAFNRAIRTTNEGFDQAQGRLQPLAAQGLDAQNLLLAALGAMGPQEQARFFQNFSDGPDVEFSRQRGLGAVERSAANRGGLFSGRTGTALSEFAQGIGEQSLRDRLTRLASAGSQGINATNNLANLDVSRSGQLSNLRTRQGDAAAQGVIGNQNESIGLLKGVGQLGAFAFGGGFQNPFSPANPLAGGAPTQPDFRRVY